MFAIVTGLRILSLFEDEYKIMLNWWMMMR